jgi:aryl sulfotransferase
MSTSPSSGIPAHAPGPAWQTIGWLASFPRSGNTWLRAMLAQLLASGDGALIEMQKVIPDLHNIFDKEALPSRHTLIVKSHDPFNLAVHKLKSLGVIIGQHRPVLIIRNPLDVIVSCFDFAVLNEAEAYAGLSSAEFERKFGGFVDEFIGRNGRNVYRHSALIDALEHFSSWYAAIRVLGGIAVRYEDIYADPGRELMQVAEYFGIPASADRIERAVEHCAFEALRSMEDTHIRHEHDADNEFFRGWRAPGYAMGRRFFNEGRPGRGIERLTRHQIARVAQRFHRIFQAFDYGGTGLPTRSRRSLSQSSNSSTKDAPDDTGASPGEAVDNAPMPQSEPDPAVREYDASLQRMRERLVASETIPTSEVLELERHCHALAGARSFCLFIEEHALLNEIERYPERNDLANRLKWIQAQIGMKYPCYFLGERLLSGRGNGTPDNSNLPQLKEMAVSYRNHCIFDALSELPVTTELKLIEWCLPQTEDRLERYHLKRRFDQISRSARS